MKRLADYVTLKPHLCFDGIQDYILDTFDFLIDDDSFTKEEKEKILDTACFRAENIIEQYFDKVQKSQYQYGEVSNDYIINNNKNFKKSPTDILDEAEKRILFALGFDKR